MHPTHMASRRLGLAVALALALVAAPALVAAKDLPAPRALIDRHLAAIGGADALRDSGDGTAKISIEVAENGMRGDMVLYARGEDLVMNMTMMGMQISMGSVGGVSWSIDPMLGPRLIEGEELEEQRRQMDPDVLTFSDAAIESMKTVALADSEGRPCYRVEIAWKDGNDTATCFDVDDGLALSSEFTSTSPMGETRQTMHLYDYKQYGAVKMASRMQGKTMGMTQIMTIDSFEFGTPPDSAFALPAAIVALTQADADAEDVGKDEARTEAGAE